MLVYINITFFGVRCFSSLMNAAFATASGRSLSHRFHSPFISHRGTARSDHKKLQECGGNPSKIVYFFLTCQVRVVRFYLSCLVLLLLLLPPPPPPAASSSSSRCPPRPLVVLLVLLLNCDSRSTVFAVGPQPRPSTPSVPCRTSTTTIHTQCSLPDLNHDHPRPVFPAGPQPRPSTPSVPCRTSTTTSHAECSLPDLNHDHPRPVFPAGPQPRVSTPSVPCRTSCRKIWDKE